MSAPLRLVLARHGQTPANVDRVLDTHLPGPGLTDLGRAQAAALGRELAGGAEGPITAVYHSRATRAAETAGLLADALDLSPCPVDDAEEVQVGDLEGRNDDAAVTEFRAVFDSWQHGDLARRQAGGESGHDLLDRYRRVVAGLVGAHPDGGTLVLVSHGAALRLAATDLVAGVGVPAPEDDHVANCGRVVMERADGVTGGPSVTGGRQGGWQGGWRLLAWRDASPGDLPATRDATG